jgi:methionyl-tRNA synthetase
MGKDNVPFHTVIFPASLIGSRDSYTLLNHISTTEFLDYEGQKFSKSRGVGVFGDQARDTGIPSEVWRYYLLSNRPENSDSSFQWADLREKNNGELLANLGNFTNRILGFVAQKFGGKTPEADLVGNEGDQAFFKEVSVEISQYHRALEAVSLKEGLKIAMGISRLGNKYFQGESKKKKNFTFKKKNEIIKKKFKKKKKICR